MVAYCNGVAAKEREAQPRGYVLGRGFCVLKFVDDTITQQ